MDQDTFALRRQPLLASRFKRELTRHANVEPSSLLIFNASSGIFFSAKNFSEAAMLSDTTQRSELNTSPALNREFEKQLEKNISRYAGADRQAIDQRLRELDGEWNIERMIETEAPTMISLGIALGTLANRKWFAVSAMAASMVILHNLQGWYPLLPVFRRLGLRTQQEIEQERMALKVLRGDHDAYQAHSTH